MSDQEKIEALKDQINMLRECVKMLAYNCTCSGAERISGHRADCPKPEIDELLNEGPFRN
jgi:hypothetical protein